jgi:hypothetical protein
VIADSLSLLLASRSLPVRDLCHIVFRRLSFASKMEWEGKNLENAKKEKMMTATANQDQEIILYESRSKILGVALMGTCLLIGGVIIPFFAGWRLIVLGLSLFLVIAGTNFLILAWKVSHTPTLIINAEGICSLHPMLRTKIKWEEIDSIYRINARNGAVFAVDLSSAGLISFFSRQGRGIPGHLNISEPQLALGIPETNLPLPVDQCQGR